MSAVGCNLSEPWNEAREKEINTYLQFLDGESHSDAAWLSNYYVIQKSKISSEMPQALAAFLEGNQPVFAGYQRDWRQWDVSM